MKIAIVKPFSSVASEAGAADVETSRADMAAIMDRIQGAMMEGYVLSFAASKSSRIEAAAKIGAACRALQAFAEGFEKAAAQSAQDVCAFEEADIPAIESAVGLEFDRLMGVSDAPAKGAS